VANAGPDLPFEQTVRGGLLALLGLAGLLAGCASSQPAPEASAAKRNAQSCVRYLEALDRETASSGVIDGQAARVDGYPYLRADRFLASFTPGSLDAAGFAEWLARLQALDVEGRRVETANLPQVSRERLAARFDLVGPEPTTLAYRAEVCASVLRHELVDSPDLRYELVSRVRVPDDYLDWQRVVGLYPLSQIPFGLGVQAWERDTARQYAEPVESLQARGEPVIYAPPPSPTLDPAATAAHLQRWSANLLGIPSPSSDELYWTLLAHAPVFTVDTATDDDRIGALERYYGQGRRLATQDAVVYGYASHTRWRGAVLLQLNYVAWFPARPRDGPFDLLGGHLDGVTWRVTLAPDGTVLVADTIHNCGCYHLFFPSARLRPGAFGAAQEERPFSPQSLPSLGPGERYELRIESGTHYVLRVLAVAAVAGNSRSYAIRHYDTLRSLSAPDRGRRSLFGPDGIVPGTERGERFLFWPMGVPDPGAMRQRGRHATAFVGRRHFDDPWLIESSFETVGP
jgi:hypothetical protein